MQKMYIILKLHQVFKCNFKSIFLSSTLNLTTIMKIIALATVVLIQGVETKSREYF